MNYKGYTQISQVMMVNNHMPIPEFLAKELGMKFRPTHWEKKVFEPIYQYGEVVQELKSATYTKIKNS